MTIIRNDIVAMAQRWAEWGATVLPCQNGIDVVNPKFAPNAKVPLHKDWQRTPYLRSKEVVAQFPAHTPLNLGILGGCERFGVSGAPKLVCIEFDHPDAATNFFIEFGETLRKRPTRIEYSASKNLAHVFMWVQDAPKYVKFPWCGEHGGEIRSIGNTVVAPSYNPKSNKYYQVFADVPPAVYTHIERIVAFLKPVEVLNFEKLNRDAPPIVINGKPTLISVIKERFPTSLAVFHHFEWDREGLEDMGDGNIRVKGHGGLICRGAVWNHFVSNVGGDVIDAAAYCLTNGEAILDRADRQQLFKIAQALIPDKMKQPRSS